MTDTSTTTPPKRLPRLLADVAIAAMLIYAGSSSDASAYIDPGSGGAIITGILGFFAAVAYTARKYWYRLKGKATGKPADKRGEPSR